MNPLMPLVQGRVKYLSLVRARVLGGLIVVVVATGLVACTSGLLPKPAVQAVRLSLDDGLAADVGAANAAVAGAANAAVAAPSAPTLSVDLPRAAAGHDTRDIVYRRRAQEVEYFAQHQWVDTPVRMLAPLMVQALQRSGSFSAVTQATSSAAGSWRLETDAVRLEQDFTVSPSRVRLSLRVLLVDSRTRQVLGWRELDSSVAAASDDPYGGALAARQATQQVLADLARFCAQVRAR